MDKQALEFWGNTLIGMAKNQEQVEAMRQWIDQGMKLGMSGLEAWTDFLSRVFMPDSEAVRSGAGNRVAPASSPASAWGRPIEDLQASINWFRDIMGFVPRQEHLRIVEKYEALKQRAADLEETIRHLRLLQCEESADRGTVVKDFKRMIEQQTEQFQDLVKNTEKFFTYAASSSKPSEQV